MELLAIIVHLILFFFLSVLINDMMKINSFMVVFTIISFAWQSTHALDTETFHKNLTRLKAMEKIKHEILRGLGLNNRPIAAPPSQKNLYVLIHNITNPKGRPAEVNEIISFSEAPGE